MEEDASEHRSVTQQRDGKGSPDVPGAFISATPGVRVNPFIGGVRVREGPHGGHGSRGATGYR